MRPRCQEGKLTGILFAATQTQGHAATTLDTPLNAANLQEKMEN